MGKIHKELNYQTIFVLKVMRLSRLGRVVIYEVPLIFNNWEKEEKTIKEKW